MVVIVSSKPYNILKTHFVQVFSVLLIFCSSFSYGNEYLYAGLRFFCELEADQASIGVRKKSLGKVKTSILGIQLFKIKGQSNYFVTSYVKSADVNVVDLFLEKGGIPNEKATKNWRVGDQVRGFNESIEFPRSSISIPLKFTPLSDIDVRKQTRQDQHLAVYFEKKLSLKDLREFLILTGAKDVPNFENDVPEITPDYSEIKWDFMLFKLTTLSVGAFNVESLIRWQANPNEFSGGGWAIVDGGWGSWGIWGVQIHYPADKHNGLSYHLKLKCKA